MDGWITLTDDDVLAQFNDSEQSAYDAAKGDANGVDLAYIIGATIAQIVDAYRNGGRVVDTQGGTIPLGERNRAIAIIRWKYLLALPTGTSLQTKERQKQNDDAEAYFLMIAKREIKPPGATAVARPGQHVHREGYDRLGSTGGGHRGGFPT